MYNKKIVLIHGFMRDSRDMSMLSKHLGKLGYECILVDLPLTFKPLEHSVSLLEELLQESLLSLTTREKLHLVGHSTGGLVIRSWLATSGYSQKIERCVLLATPNHGSELADLAGKYFRVIPAICKTLGSLQTNRVRAIQPLSNLPVEMGAIAGNKNNLLLGHLLKGENDGRVTVDSVWMAGLKDFLVLPFGHLEIHKTVMTAQYVDRFLRTGSFR